MKYKVKLGDKAYEVEVENGQAKMLGVTDTAGAPEAPQPVSPPAAAPDRAPGAGEVLPAPMPGAIIDITVSAGEPVKKGQTLFILEAMKMENEIVAPGDAVVTKIAVNKGDTVSAGDPLAWLA